MNWCRRVGSELAGFGAFVGYEWLVSCCSRQVSYLVYHITRDFTSLFWWLKPTSFMIEDQLIGSSILALEQNQWC